MRSNRADRAGYAENAGSDLTKEALLNAMIKTERRLIIAAIESSATIITRLCDRYVSHSLFSIKLPFAAELKNSADRIIGLLANLLHCS